jgi:hypothetical protein
LTLAVRRQRCRTLDPIPHELDHGTVTSSVRPPNQVMPTSSLAQPSPQGRRAGWTTGRRDDGTTEQQDGLTGKSVRASVVGVTELVLKAIADPTRQRCVPCSHDGSTADDHRTTTQPHEGVPSMRMTVSSLLVDDQQRALALYTGTLALPSSTTPAAT